MSKKANQKMLRDVEERYANPGTLSPQHEYVNADTSARLYPALQRMLREIEEQNANLYVEEGRKCRSGPAWELKGPTPPEDIARQWKKVIRLLKQLRTARAELDSLLDQENQKRDLRMLEVQVALRNDIALKMARASWNGVLWSRCRHRKEVPDWLNDALVTRLSQS